MHLRGVSGLEAGMLRTVVEEAELLLEQLGLWAGVIRTVLRDQHAYADTNRCALGDGSLDLDSIIIALNLIGYNNDKCFVTPNPSARAAIPIPRRTQRPIRPFWISWSSTA